MVELQIKGEPAESSSTDFALIIDFKKGEGSPTRVFSAAKDLIEAFQLIDRFLVQSIDTNIKPLMILENVESGSLKIKLRNVLSAIDDKDLESLDWKKIIGKFLVRGKHKILDWLDDDKPKSLPNLQKDLKKLARETGIKGLSDYSSSDLNKLIEGIKKIQKAKDTLLLEDQAFFEAGDQKHKIDIPTRFTQGDLKKIAIKRTTAKPPIEMILVVKKPDYLGSSKWDFRIEKQAISARINDPVFLYAFKARQLKLSPGDSLKCMVSIETIYGFDDKEISKNYVISKVLEVLYSN